MLRIFALVFLVCIGALLLNNALSFGFSGGLEQFLRAAGGIAALASAVALVLE